MEDVLVPIVVVPVIFFSIVYTIKIISDNGIRRRLIEKGQLDENVKHLFARERAEMVPNSLKWGMVLIALGAAVLIGELAPYSFHEEATISAMFILGGGALIAYYFVARRLSDKADDDSGRAT